MNITKLCIKHHVMTILCYILVAVFGVYCFSSLPLSLLPDMEVPVAVVFSTYVGASPEDIEQQVTKPLEQACASLSGMDVLSSSSSENMSMVIVNFVNGTNLDEAMVEMRDKVKQVESMLPEDASTPTVMSVNLDAMPVVQVALRGADLATLQSVAENELAPALERQVGIASVNISGGYKEKIAVRTNPSMLEGYHLTISSVAQQLGVDNMAVPGGDLTNGTQTLGVRTDGEYRSVRDVQNALISLPAGGTVRLGQIAEVALEPADKSVIARVDGEECVLLSVSKQSGANTVKVAERAVKVIREQTAGSAALTADIVMDQSEFVNITVDNAVSNIVYGVLFAAAVILLFLRDLGATVTLSVAMPLCILFTFLIMYGLDITLNMMSLGGITLGVGMIVDNSIVVLDNIFRFRADGYERREACLQGTKEVTMSIVASTLTTVCVFLPIALSGGLTGMMFREFCLTIVVLLLSSLLIALTLVPLLCYFLLRDKPEKLHKRGAPIAEVKDKFIEHKPAQGLYGKMLKTLLAHRSIGIVLTVAIVAASIVSIGLAGGELMPAMDQGQIDITVSMPSGSTMEQTAQIQERVVRIAMDTVPEMEQVYYTTGDATAITTGATGASITIKLVDLEQRTRGVSEIASQLRRDLADIAGCELTVSDVGMMSMETSEDINLILTGKDYETLAVAAQDLAKQIALLPDAVNVKSSAGDQVPRVSVKINRENAARFGLNAATIGTLVRGELTGSTATTVRMSGKEYDVSVSGADTVSQSLEALRALSLPTATGGTVPLGMVAEVTTELAPQSIERRNQRQVVTISGSTESGDAAAMSAAIDGLLATYDLPEGIETDSSDSANAQMIETVTTLMTALAAAISLVYFVLASQYNSFVLPIIIMTILPIGLFSSLMLLWPTGNKVSMVAILGVVILAGTVVNSSIVLVDYIEQRRAAGEDKNTAILRACPRRVRPVLMTALTTILGLVPMVFQTGEGAEMMRPMGIVMMTGMVVSTLATLFITPVYYSLMDSLTTRVGRLFGRKKSAPTAAQTPSASQG